MTRMVAAVLLEMGVEVTTAAVAQAVVAVNTVMEEAVVTMIQVGIVL